MRAITQTPIYIVSAELDTLSGKENVKRTDELMRLLEQMDTPHKKVLGSYKGKEEEGFVINATKSEAMGLGQSYGQESVLFVDQFANASLIYLKGADNGKTEHIGELVQVTEEEAKKQDGWTYDRLNKRWFIIR